VSHDPPIVALGGSLAFSGSQFSVRVERFRHADGVEVEREVVRRTAAAAIVAYDDTHVWLVRQPREALAAYTLELPAGKLDVAGESPLQTAQRELAEEIGQEAEHWREVRSFHPSSGYTDEIVHIFCATGLRASAVESDPEERIEVVRWPLGELEAALASTQDAKTVIGLHWLQATLG
jgi:ADP-ribose pyrophosphatase